MHGGRCKYNPSFAPWLNNELPGPSARSQIRSPRRILHEQQTGQRENGTRPISFYQEIRFVFRQDLIVSLMFRDLLQTSSGLLFMPTLVVSASGVLNESRESKS